jgi:hypothetical protein
MPRVSNERAGTPPPLQLPLTRRDRRGTAGDRIRLGAEMKMQQGTGEGKRQPTPGLSPLLLGCVCNTTLCSIIQMASVLAAPCRNDQSRAR